MEEKMQAHESKSQGLWCNSLKIFYTYSFLFTRVNFEVKKTVRENELKKAEIENKLKVVMKEENGYQVNFHWGEHFNTEHTPVFPLLFIRCPHILVGCSPRKGVKLQGKIEHNGQKEEIIIENINIIPTLVLLDTGMGICRIKIEINKENSNIKRLEKRHIIALTNTGEIRSEEDSRFRYHIKDSNGKTIYLFSIFDGEVKKLKEAVKKIDSTVKWVEKEYHLKYHIEGVKESENIEHFQDPYITLFLDIPDNDFKEYLLDTDEDTRKKEDGKASRYYRDIASILLIRSRENRTLDSSFVRTYIDCADEAKLLNAKPANMCANSKFFMHLHTEITLAMYSDKEKNTPFIKTSITTLNKTISFLLMRWYSYVIANAWLDSEIAGIYDQFLKLVRGSSSSNAIQSFYEKQEEIIKLRGRILGILQDPITYRTSSGSSMILYEKGMEKFRIKQLEDIILNKIKEVDRLYEMINSYRYRKDIIKGGKRVYWWSEVLIIIILGLLFFFLFKHFF